MSIVQRIREAFIRNRMRPERFGWGVGADVSVTWHGAQSVVRIQRISRCSRRL